MGEQGGVDDVLSELLMPLRLRSVFHSKWLARSPWAIEGEGDDYAVIHYLVENDCHISFGDGETFHLPQGSLAVFPHGTAHVLADRPGRTPRRPLSSILPHRRPGTSSVVSFGGSGTRTTILCGSLQYDTAGEPHLYRTLPRVLVLDADLLASEPLLLGMLESLVRETVRTGPGTHLVTLRAFEMIFVLALRVALEYRPDLSPALLALRHPGISKALLAIYSEYERPWTIDTLARHSGMSPSAFRKTFRALVGDSPAQHLTNRRMQAASRLLTESSLGQAAIAEMVGYQSVVGFHLAFRREFGMTPGDYRRGGLVPVARVAT